MNMERLARLRSKFDEVVTAGDISTLEREVESLHDLLSTDDTEVLAETLSILADLAEAETSPSDCIGSPCIEQATGLIPLIIQLSLQHKRSSQVLNPALRLLRCVTRSKDGCQQVYGAEGVDAMLVIMKERNPSQILVNAASVLHNLEYAFEGKPPILDKDTVIVLGKVLKKLEAEFKGWTRKSFRRLVAFSKVDLEDKCEEWYLDVVGMLTVTEDGLQVLVDSSAGYAIARVVESRTTTPEVLELALDAVYRLSYTECGVGLIASSGLMKTVASLMARTPSYQVKCKCVDMINLVVRYPEGVSAVAESGVINTMIGWMNPWRPRFHNISRFQRISRFHRISNQVKFVVVPTASWLEILLHPLYRIIRAITHLWPFSLFLLPRNIIHLGVEFQSGTLDTLPPDPRQDQQIIHLEGEAQSGTLDTLPRDPRQDQQGEPGAIFMVAQIGASNKEPPDPKQDLQGHENLSQSELQRLVADALYTLVYYSVEGRKFITHSKGKVIPNVVEALNIAEPEVACSLFSIMSTMVREYKDCRKQFMEHRAVHTVLSKLIQPMDEETLTTGINTLLCFALEAEFTNQLICEDLDLLPMINTISKQGETAHKDILNVLDNLMNVAHTEHVQSLIDQDVMVFLCDELKEARKTCHDDDPGCSIRDHVLDMILNVLRKAADKLNGCIDVLKEQDCMGYIEHHQYCQDKAIWERSSKIMEICKEAEEKSNPKQENLSLHNVLFERQVSIIDDHESFLASIGSKHVPACDMPVIYNTIEKLTSFISEDDPRLSGCLYGVGSHYDGTKIPPADEQDFIFILNSSILENIKVSVCHSHDLLFYIYCSSEGSSLWEDLLYPKEDLYQFFAVKLFQKFFLLMNKRLHELQLPDGLSHGGLCSPGFSGLRDNLPAVTTLFDQDGLSVTVDVTVGIALPKHLEEEVMCHLPEDCMLRLKRSLENDPESKMVLVPTEGDWFRLSTTLVEVNLMKKQPREGAFKRSIILSKFINSKIFTVSTPEEVRTPTIDAPDCSSSESVQKSFRGFFSKCNKQTEFSGLSPDPKRAQTVNLCPDPESGPEGNESFDHCLDPVRFDGVDICPDPESGPEGNESVDHCPDLVRFDGVDLCPDPERTGSCDICHDPEGAVTFIRDLHERDPNNSEIDRCLQFLMTFPWILKHGIHPNLQIDMGEKDKSLVSTSSCIYKYKALELFLDGKISEGMSGAELCIQILKEYLQELIHPTKSFKHPLLGHRLTVRGCSPYLFNGNIPGLTMTLGKDVHTKTVEKVMNVIHK